MSEKNLPFSNDQIQRIARDFPTPFHLYCEKEMVENVDRLKSAFSASAGFREYFAVKALPNPYIMKILHGRGLGMDCSSKAELALCAKIGVRGEEIMFTSNDTPQDEYEQALELGAILNLDDITHIEFIEQFSNLPELVCFRYNPGPLRAGNVIIGKPEEAKYGFTREQLFAGYKLLKDKGVKRFGLHTMVASNELDAAYFAETVQMLCDLVVEISREVGIRFEFINMGGGIGIPYKPGQSPVSLERVGREAQQIIAKTVEAAGLGPLKLYMECGRMITGPYGFLITRAIHSKSIYKNYVGLDASMADLMRPGMYGAYHHITVVGKQSQPHDRTYDVTGSLCENNDKFAVDRQLPAIVPGDLLVIHDTGAHGHAMGFNYNGKLRAAELLLRTDGSVVRIRRREELADLFATLDFDQLSRFSG